MPELNLLASDIVFMLLVGLGAGVLGGLLGIGGSIITIPALAIIFDHRPWASQHLIQAAAMITNVFVALPAARKHMRSGLLKPNLHRRMLPAAIISIIVGVLLSDLLPSRELRLVFALFLLYIAFDSIVKAVSRRHEHPDDAARVTPMRASIVGTAMGLVSGLLGVGGGGVAVPLAHKVCRLRLAQCIAASAAVMCIMAPIGAFLKVARIGQHGHAVIEPIVLALILVPTAMLGAHWGATLTYKAPVRVLRACFAAAVLAVSIRLIWQSLG